MQVRCGLGQQGAGSIDRPREQVGLRGCHPSLGPPLQVGGQHRGAFQEPGRGGIASTMAGAGGRRLQFGRGSFVRAAGGGSQMPGPGIGVQFGVACLREGPVGPPTLTRGRGVVYRRPDERVREAHLGPEDNQSGGLHGQRGGLRDGQCGGRLP